MELPTPKLATGEWMKWEYLIPGVLMIGYLLMKGVGWLKAFGTVKELFRKRETIMSQQERLENEILEMKQHISECDKRNQDLRLVNSDMRLVLKTIRELLVDAKVNQKEELPANVLTALLTALASYKDENESHN